MHGLVRMGVRMDAPTAAQTATMFAGFRADATTAAVDGFDLTVTGDFDTITGVAFAEEEFAYRPDAILVRTPKLQILRDGSRFRLNGGGELLTTILPLIDRLMVERGAAMIHAATVTIDGKGIALPAAGGVGKTSTIAKLAKIPGMGFLGDDWAFLTSTGQVLGFAKPMFIRSHHRPIFPHLFTGRRKPLVPRSLSRPLGRLTTIVHPFIVEHPNVAAVVRRWSPEHKMVPPHKALPDVPIVERAPLSASVYLERHDGTAAELRDLPRADIVARMLGNFHSEMPLHSREVVNLLGTVGMVPLDRIFAEKARVLEEALTGVPTFLLQVPREWSADRASDAIVDELASVFSGAAVPPSGAPSGN